MDYDDYDDEDQYYDDDEDYGYGDEDNEVNDNVDEGANDDDSTDDDDVNDAGLMKNANNLTKTEERKLYNETHRVPFKSLEDIDEDEEEEEEEEGDQKNKNKNNNCFLPSNISFQSSISDVERAILKGNPDINSYITSVFQVNPFSVCKLKVRHGPLLYCLPHHLAALCGCVPYLRAILELLKTPRDVDDLVSFSKLKKDPEVVRFFQDEDHELLKKIVLAGEKFSSNKTKTASSITVSKDALALESGLRLLQLHSPLHKRPLSEFAARGGDMKMIQWLHDKNLLDPHQPNGNGDVPLYFAVQENKLNVLKFFHENCKNCDLKYTSPDNGETLLHNAAANLCPDVLEYLLKHSGVPVDAKMPNDSGSGWLTPASEACSYGGAHPDKKEVFRVLELLFEYGAFDYCYREQELCSTKAVAPERLEDVLFNRMRKEKEDTSFSSALDGKELYLKLKGMPPLLASALGFGKSDDDERSLLDSTSSSSVLNKLFLKTTTNTSESKKASPPTLRQLIEEYIVAVKKTRSDNNIDGDNVVTHSDSALPSTPLQAVYIQSKSRTRQLYTSPLHCAATNGGVDIIKWLCKEKGFAKDLSVKAPNTVLYEAIRLGECPETLELVDYLINEVKVPLDEFNEGNEKFTHVYAAAFLGRDEILRMLLKAGASMSLATSIGATPIFGAIAGSGCLECVKALVEFNCDMSCVFNGCGPIQYAKSMGNKYHIVNYLESVM